jgi:hypothetical protein
MLITKCKPVVQFFAVEHFPVNSEAKEKPAWLLPEYAIPAAMMVSRTLRNRTVASIQAQMIMPLIQSRLWVGLELCSSASSVLVSDASQSHDLRLTGRNLGFQSGSDLVLDCWLDLNMSALSRRGITTLARIWEATDGCGDVGKVVILVFRDYAGGILAIAIIFLIRS